MDEQQDYTLITPDGTKLSIKTEEFDSFLHSLQEYAGEQFLSGAENDRVCYTRILNAAGIEVGAEEEVETEA